jgi:predicted TIM-barrel fold metal-dependent hydrolase
MNHSFQIIDVAAWVGHYPFRGILSSSLEHMRRQMRGIGIAKAIVSPFEAVFWENNLDAYEQWLLRLGGRQDLELWPVVNPAMPGQLDEFKRMCESHRPRGVRLTPNYHGYRLEDTCVAALMQFAAAKEMVVQVFSRIADERWHWMLKTPPVATDEILYFTSAFAGQPMILSALNSIREIIPRMKQQPRLCVDISRLRGPIFAAEQLMAEAPPKQVLFGSLWPIQIAEATLWQVLEARMDDKIKSAVLRDNFLELVGYPDL